MISQISNTIDHPIGLNFEEVHNNCIEQKFKSFPATDAVHVDNVMDDEAQQLLSAVGNSLGASSQEASSIHNGLSYSRVMSLLEGI